MRDASQEQFAEGCAIDGLRIDKGVGDLASAFNALQPRHQRTRWVPDCKVWGWSPIGERNGNAGFALIDHHWPWMQAYNGGSWAYPAGATVEEIVNDYRHKGHQIGEVDPELNTVASGEQYAWDTPLYFRRPTVVTDLCLILSTNAQGQDYRNLFTWGTTAFGADNSTGDYVQDVVFELLIESPFARGEWARSAVALNRYYFRVDAAKFSPVAWPGYTDMNPQYLGGAETGLAIWFDHINLPIPAGSRGKISVLIPRYDDAGSFDSPWGENPLGAADNNRWAHAQRYSLTMAFLTPLRRRRQ